VQEVERRRLEDRAAPGAGWLERQQWLALLRRTAFGLRLGQHDAELHVLADTVTAPT